jgi:hypothetical protein
MDTDFLVDAIKYLKPNAEFSYINDDYSTIKWDVLEGDAPTEAEVVTAIAIVKKQKADDQAAKDAARQAVLDKLGLSADEVAALLG